jgi:hypothetical protein
MSAYEEDEVRTVASSRTACKHKVRLSIHFKTEFGEYLCVTGSIPALGNWKQFNCKLKWNEGHIWTTALETDADLFEYKYVVLHGQDLPKKWEDGLNRLCHVQEVETRDAAGVLCVQDKWNTFQVKF